MDVARKRKNLGHGGEGKEGATSVHQPLGILLLRLHLTRLKADVSNFRG